MKGKNLLSKRSSQLLEASANNASVTSKFHISLLASCVLLIALFSSFQTIFAQDVSSGMAPAGNSYLRPIHTPAPIYPAQAAKEGVFKIHSMQFNVTKEGNVDPESIFVKARNVGIEAQGRAFVEASLSALKKFKFEPPYNSSGVNIEVTGVPIQFGYREGKVETFPFVAPPILNREYHPRNLITPHYPPAAKKEKIEGYVLVEFTVTTEGDAAGIVILDRQPSGIFNASAIEAAEKFRFWPRVVDGVTVEAPGVQYTFNYNLDDD